MHTGKSGYVLHFSLLLNSNWCLVIFSLLLNSNWCLIALGHWLFGVVTYR